MGKRLMCIMALLFSFAIISTGSKTASADDTINNATPYSLGTTMNGVIVENFEKQFYKFELPSSGAIHITGSAYVQYAYFYLYDESGKELRKELPSWNSTSQLITIDYTNFLTAGTYYFAVGRYYERYGDYNFKIDFTSTGESFPEVNGGSNNKMNSASKIETTGKMYTGQIALNDDRDFYTFSLAKSGAVNLKATFYNTKYVRWKLYDNDGKELEHDTNYWNETTQNIVLDMVFHLTNGTYYISYEMYDPYEGKYDFTLPYTPSNASFDESNGGTNNSPQTASSMSTGNTYTGQLAINDEKDFYSFSLAGNSTLSINVAAKMRHITVKLYNSAGVEQWHETPYHNETTGNITFTKVTALAAGQYFISVEKYDTYGNYTVNVSQLSQNNCPHDYENKVIASTYFAKGYTIKTCKLCGKKEITNYTAVRKLSQGSISTLYSYPAKGRIFVRWYTDGDASGYQVRYSTNKKFKSGTKIKKIKGSSKNSKNLTKLKRRKKYYIQVRSYKTSGKKTVYGKWSRKVVYRTR